MENSETENDKGIELLAIRTIQHNVVFYTGIMSSEQLCSPEAVSKIRPDIYHNGGNEEGYQRNPTSSRVKDFGRYIGDNRQSPTSIIINVRDAELKFRPFPGTPKFGLLTVPSNGNLYVVDGQHRLEGLRFIYDDLKKKGSHLTFEFPVIITNMSKYEEALQFAIINRTQKGLRTELVDLVLKKISTTEDPLRAQKLPKIISRDLGWKTVAMSITDYLKTLDIWKNKLQEPNEKKSPQNVATITTIVSSLEPVVEKFNLSMIQAKGVAEILGEYWQAVSDLCPLSARQNPKSSVLMKTLGVGVMHLIFIDAVHIAQDFHNNKRDKETFKAILENAGQYMTDGFWQEASIYGSGKSSVSNVYRLLKDSILNSYESKSPAERNIF